MSPLKSFLGVIYMNRSERLNQELIFLSYRQEFHIKELM